MLRMSLVATLACSSVFIMGCQHTPPAQQKHHAHKHHAHKHHGHHHWGYGDDHGLSPENWGDIEVNKLCKTGTQQSPIDINTVFKPNPDGTLDIKQHYHLQNFNVVNNGHTIVFNAQNPSDSKISVNGKIYKLLQFHYHVPSEHTVMKEHYPLEVHFVHKSDDGLLAVIGVLFELGQNNMSLEKVIRDLPNQGDTSVKLNKFNVSSIIPKNSKTYAYNGSLTTPPCSERVQWLLKETPLKAGKSQLQRLAHMYDGNNRPVQPKNGRKVHIH